MVDKMAVKKVMTFKSGNFVFSDSISMEAIIQDHLPFSWRKDKGLVVQSNRMDIRYLPRYKFVSQNKLYQKETCDVRA